MAKMLSVRIQTSRKTKGQAGHDFNDRPAYADESRKHLNKTIFGGAEAEIKSLIDSQSRSIIQRFNDAAAVKRNKKELVSKPEERRKIGSWRKTTATHKNAIITFSSEVRAEKDTINRDDLDKCALDFFTGFCKKNNCSLTYIVRHDDETTPHYHATFTNLNEKTLKPLRFEMRHLSSLQDRAGEAFKPMGIRRGIKRDERLDIARTNHPKEDGESDEMYKKRIYQLANVRYRTVAQNHDRMREDFEKIIAEKKAVVWDLDDEIREEQADIERLEVGKNQLKQGGKKLLDGVKILQEQADTLKSEIENQSVKARKMTVLQEKAEIKLQELDSENGILEAKIQKNIGIYERREQAALAAIVPLKKQIAVLNGQVNKLKEQGRRHIEINNQTIAQHASIGSDSYLEKLNSLEALARPNLERIHQLERENDLLREKLEQNNVVSQNMRMR